MKINNGLLFFVLMLVVISCLGTISAASNENMNLTSDADFFSIESSNIPEL